MSDSLIAWERQSLLFLRWFAARRNLPGTDISRFKHLNPTILKRLLTFGSLITVVQIADYLYSPTDFLLISLLLHPIEAATYAPAVQIDAGILLLVGGLAAVVLPKAALAHASQDHAALRRYYFLGTFFSVGVLLFAAFGAWAIAPKLFKIWFGDKLWATLAILPLVLIHTVIGGSSSVGRSILIGMNKSAIHRRRLNRRREQRFSELALRREIQPGIARDHSGDDRRRGRTLRDLDAVVCDEDVEKSE